MIFFFLETGEVFVWFAFQEFTGTRFTSHLGYCIYLCIQNVRIHILTCFLHLNLLESENFGLIIFAVHSTLCLYYIQS